MSMQDMEGYQELMDKLLDTLPPEQVLAHYAPEQRLAGLTSEQAVLAMPVDVLRGLSADYLATLSEATRVEIGKRLGRS